MCDVPTRLNMNVVERLFGLAETVLHLCAP
jgi:hypothetical protein